MMFNLFLTFVFCDFAVRGQFGFQDAATSIMQGIINLHHHIFFFIIIVLLFVFYIMFRTYCISVWKFKNLFFVKESLSYFELCVANRLFKHNNLIKKLKLYSLLNVSHGTTLEIIWTILPSLILLFIVGPSFSLLFAMDAIMDPEYSIKIIGHQWYWSYEYSDSLLVNNFANDMTYIVKSDNLLNLFTNYSSSLSDVCSFTTSFDSYMVATNDLVEGQLRLLEVDMPLYLPVYSKIRLDITSDDVMHAFAVPSFGIKIDAIPGRLNVVYLDVLREGVFFGQCSELCGVNHGYMPIKIIVLDLGKFLSLYLPVILSADFGIVKGSSSSIIDLFSFVLKNNSKYCFNTNL